MFDSEFAENLLEKIGGNSATLVFSDSGKCLFASSNSIGVLGASSEDLKTRIVDQSFLDNLHLYTLEGGLLDKANNPVAKALKDKNFIQTTPFFCKLSKDAEDVLALNTFVIENQTGNYFVVVQIRKAKREVDVGEMKSLFVSFAAHQLKTPSSVVKGFIELMMRQGEPAYSKEQWHFLTSAFEANEQLIEVSKSLLNMARLEGGLIEPKAVEFDPNRALQTKIASFAPLYKTKRVNVNLSASSEENFNSLRSDESFFLEVFGILLGNAIKHSPIGESITVSSVISKNGCEVHIMDNGPGIAKAVRETLFKSEQGSSEKENSHGLGLFMAKKYIALLGGSIGLEESEIGSDFYFTVPNLN